MLVVDDSRVAGIWKCKGGMGSWNTSSQAVCVVASCLGCLGSIVVNIKLVARNLAAMSDQAIREKHDLIQGRFTLLKATPHKSRGKCMLQGFKLRTPDLYIEFYSCTGRPLPYPIGTITSCSSDLVMDITSAVNKLGPTILP